MKVRLKNGLSLSSSKKLSCKWESKARTTKTIKLGSEKNGSQREQSPRQTGSSGSNRISDEIKTKCKFCQPAMVNWLQSRFVESHIRVGNYNNVAFVFYIYNLFTVISQWQLLSLEN